MKKLILTCGIIAGFIVSAWLVLALMMGLDNMDTSSGMFLGFTVMIVAFSFIYVVVKNYRDKLNSGSVTFGKAFRIGLYITLIASSMYVACWLIEYYFFVPDFMEQYAAHAVDKLRQSGAPAAEVEATAREMAEFREMYKNPLFVILITYTEILPAGIIISLITALILKRKPAAAQTA